MCFIQFPSIYLVGGHDNFSRKLYSPNCYIVRSSRIWSLTLTIKFRRPRLELHIKFDTEELECIWSIPTIWMDQIGNRFWAQFHGQLGVPQPYKETHTYESLEITPLVFFLTNVEHATSTDHLAPHIHRPCCSPFYPSPRYFIFPVANATITSPR